MKKLNFNKLSNKQIQNILFKAAFSKFVKSLKVSEHWKCCQITYKTLQEVHKHVSVEHIDLVKDLICDLNEESQSKDRKLEEQQFPTLELVKDYSCQCFTKTYVVILFYHYTNISYNLKTIKNWQENVSKKLDLKGKIRIASEGINGTVEGCSCSIEAYKQTLTGNELFQGISYDDFKHSIGNGDCFDGLSVTICNELCTLGISPSNLSFDNGGTHLSPQGFHRALALRKEMQEKGNSENIPLLLDCRNFYESEIGYFDDAIKPDLRKFSYFPEYVDQNLDLFDGREVLTYCTGGIRCERATAYIKKATNCLNIYQLHGGIHKYLEQFPDGFFKGRLFVFDKRYSIDIGPGKSEITSLCFYCKTPYDKYELCSWKACRQLVLICEACRKAGKTNCCEMCKNNSLNEIASEQCECTAKRDRPSKQKLKFAVENKNLLDSK